METPLDLQASGQPTLEPQQGLGLDLTKDLVLLVERLSLEERIWMPVRETHQLVKILVKMTKSSFNMLTNTMLSREAMILRVSPISRTRRCFSPCCSYSYILQ